MIWILIGITILVSFLVAFKGKVFRYDQRNPYRRYCLTCHQCQEQYMRSYNNRDAWWEDTGTIFDPLCHCHKYQEYRR